MTAAYLFGAIGFLVLGLVLLFASLISFFVTRDKATTPAVQPPEWTPAPEPPRMHTPVSPPAPHTPSSPDATVVVNLNPQSWGELRGVSGPLAGRVIPITADGFYIGREQGVAQIVIEDQRVSKRHLWVGVRDGVVMAIDEGSTNGTYLNERRSGTRITSVQLNPGDTLIISEDVARLVYQR